DIYRRSPPGERQPTPVKSTQDGGFLSTLPARGATADQEIMIDDSYNFYPRSPRGERRAAGVPQGDGDVVISIHAPREGSDSRAYRRAQYVRHFYPRSPRGERRGLLSWSWAETHFYPRSPRGERLCRLHKCEQVMKFLSTLPARGATWHRSYPPE